jgi:hypothetical protein
MCLKKALAYALNVPLTTRGGQFPSRASLFRDIVCCYINEGKSLHLERNLPPSLLKKMEKTSSASTLYKHCVQAAEMYMLSECSATLQGKIAALEDSLFRMQLQNHDSDSQCEATSDSLVFMPAYTSHETPMVTEASSQVPKFDLKNERSFR